MQRITVFALILGLSGALLAPRASEASVPGYVPRLTVPTLEAPRRAPSLRLLAEESYDVAKLNDGTVLVGKIMRENEVGVVFRTADGKTRLIKYADLADLQSTKSGGTPVTTPAAGGAPAPVPAPPPGSALSPELAAKRRTLAAERDGLVERRAKINLLPSTLGLIGGLVMMVAVPFLFTNPTERTAGFIVGGLVAGLGALGLIFKVSARGQLDRQIRQKNREIQRLYPETTRAPAGQGPIDGFQVAVVSRF